MTVWAIEIGIIERLYTLDRGVRIALAEAGAAADRGSASGPRDGHGPRRRAAVSGGLVRPGDPPRTHGASGRAGCRRRARQALRREPAEGRVEAPAEQPPAARRARARILSAGVRAGRDRPPAGVARGARGGWRLPKVEAAWLHHRFAQIHPSDEGNGRVGRASAIRRRSRSRRWSESSAPPATPAIWCWTHSAAAVPQSPPRTTPAAVGSASTSPPRPMDIIQRHMKPAGIKVETSGLTGPRERPHDFEAWAVAHIPGSRAERTAWRDRGIGGRGSDARHARRPRLAPGAAARAAGASARPVSRLAARDGTRGHRARRLRHA